MNKWRSLPALTPKFTGPCSRESQASNAGLLIETDMKLQAIEQALELGCRQIGWMNQLGQPRNDSSNPASSAGNQRWTVNDIDRAKQLRDFGINGSITDFPKLMMQASRVEPDAAWQSQSIDNAGSADLFVKYINERLDLHQLRIISAEP